MKLPVTASTPRRVRPLTALIAALCLSLAGLAPLQAATLPAGFAESTFASGLSNPTAMAFAPDGRLFVCQQGGQVAVIKNGVKLATPFVDLTAKVNASGERGVLGIAFDPNFAANRFVYVYYTATSPALHNRISRFTANGDIAESGSEAPIVDLENLSSATNHNGGAMHFGPDGKLYIAVGENAYTANSQTLANRLGKMLRVNSDGSAPADNPFYTADGAFQARDHVWALGLRNPFTFAFQAGTGRLFINDVGQNTWEEINDGYAGANYGWPNTEGVSTNTAFQNPVYAYGHGTSDTTGCAITGGAFYNPPTPQFPGQYVGTFFFADYCSGWVRRLDPSTGAVSGFGTGFSNPTDLKVGPDGSLYVLARGTSAILKVSYTLGQAPAITQQPSGVTVAVGQTATFRVSASGSTPLSYQWQKEGVNISGATGTSYTTPPAAPEDNGKTFRCIVTNSVGSATSDSAALTVTSNKPPAASITAPAAGATYTAGDTISYAGTGTDPEDGDLPASAFTWRVDFHHDTHTHPFVADTTGVKSGAFTIPTTGETATNVWYRIRLTVKDAVGLEHATYRDLRPRTALITLATSPAGLQVTLDGQPKAGPYSESGVVGTVRTLGVVSPQTVNGVTYEFVSWSDGGAATHGISSPASNTTYTATFRQSGGSASGTGLKGEYHRNKTLSSLSLTRTDAQVDFAWGSGSPAPGLPADKFSVRWTGQVQAPEAGAYTFYTVTDDGVRLWINGVQVINAWKNQSRERQGTPVTLTAGQKYSVKMEYYENGGGAKARLLWSGPGVPKAVVPKSRLFPAP